MPEQTKGPPSAEGVATVRELAEAIGRSDLTRVRELFAPDVRLRALTPRGIDDAHGPDETARLLGYWAENYDSVELVETTVEAFGTRTLLRYRLRVQREDELPRRFALQAVCDAGGGVISAIDQVCGGSQPEG